jgi:hypothetical protein
MNKIVRKLKSLFIKKEDYQYLPLEPGIEMLNFWPSQEPKDIWIYQYFKARYSDIISSGNPLLISSLFGPRHRIVASPSKIKVFFSGENVDRFPEYKDHCISDVDLSLGFEYLLDPNYARMPLWLFFIFQPTDGKKEIQAKLDNITNGIRYNFSTNKKFCSLICSHDKNGNRGKLFKLLSEIDRVDSAGKFLNNTSDLKHLYNDDKRLFLKDYKFNICPENTDKWGYVTEKIFESIAGGCIPVYWGSGNRPEPEIINQKAVLFYESKSQSSYLMNEVKLLHENPRAYEEFATQDRFLPHAAEYIAEMLNTVDRKFRNIVHYNSSVFAKYKN